MKIQHYAFALILSSAFLCGMIARPVCAQPAPATTPAATATTPATASPQQAYTLPPEKLAKAIALSRIRNILNIAGSVWGVVFLWLLLEMRTWAWLERRSEKIGNKRWVQGLIFFAALLLLTAIASLPLDMAGHHYSNSYGVGVQGWGGWFADLAKSLGLTLVLGAPLLLLFNWIVGRWPKRYWLGLWLATLPLLVLAIFVSPLIEPLFEKFEPLQTHHAELVTDLEKVVARTGTHIPPDRMYLDLASLKSNGLNAYVSGMGATKRIVVWDTTAGRIPNDQVQFIFGHESGHYVLNHIPKEIALDAAGLFFVYWACAVAAAWLVRRFGARWGAEGAASRTGFAVLLFAISAASFVLQPASSGCSRYFEHQADIYGQEAIHGIVADPQKTTVAAFNSLGDAWLEDPAPSPFIEFWLYDHPSVQTRANFALHYDPWANGGHGEFFKN